MTHGRYVLATAALLLAGCGADDPQGAVAIDDESSLVVATSTAPGVSVLNLTEKPTTTTSAPAITGLPPVTFADGASTTTLAAVPNSDEPADDDERTVTGRSPATSAPGRGGSAASTTSTTTTAAPTSGGSTTTSTQAPPLFEGDSIEDILPGLEIGDVAGLDLAELFPTQPPVGGEGTTVQLTVSPSTGLQSGNTVILNASNMPPAQGLAYAQCNTLIVEVISIEALASDCQGFGINFSLGDGTGSFELTVTDTVNGTDCRVQQCYIGLAVLPGSADFVAFQPIDFA